MKPKANPPLTNLLLRYWFIPAFFILPGPGCAPKQPAMPVLFDNLDPKAAGITFQNDLYYTEAFNPYTFRNFFNGGGVGLGDVNNDGWVDIYFCGNLADNKLYLNRGNWQFEDVTEYAGVASKGVWSTGVSIADVNGDGLLDLYVCKSGEMQGENRHNELFINQGNDPAGRPKFLEQAEVFGLDDKGLSTHAAFFDYDKDGDLDCYLLNNSFRSVGGYDLIPGQRERRDTLGGNKLYRNEGEKFVDVSAEAGIYGSAIGFGLGVTIGDINRDGWQDIYVSNDFFERDYLYINQKDGTFKENLEAAMPEISLGSMGADMADINNDGLPEVFVTDMLPEDDARIKTTTTFENWDKYQLNLRNGYHRQFTRNVLQFNRGDGSFSEISRFAGVSATDWSWGALMADFDNDGLRDIFVANGIYKDLNDQDYIQFMGDPATIRAILQRDNAVIKRLIDSIPSQAIPNYAFRNLGVDGNGIQFTNAAADWGLDMPSWSNGSAYGDLDNDGDLDLVINNVNMPPFLLRNRSDEWQDAGHFLQVQLKGIGKNSFALGAQVTLKAGEHTYYQELAPMRGFESCVDYTLHFGLGKDSLLDTVRVLWPDQTETILTQVVANQRLQINHAAAQRKENTAIKMGTPTVFRMQAGPDFVHQENDFSDFDRDYLLYHMLSAEGPALAVGDANGDALEDVYIGGAKEQPGALFLQMPDGRFQKTAIPAFDTDALSEDVDAAWLDVDGDGDLDLYVASGGSEFANISAPLSDRLYINKGSGKFEKSSQTLPAGKYESSSCIKPADFDQDGDLDLFVGIRQEPFFYGKPCSSYILENNGEGQFTPLQISGLQDIGMVTDAHWSDWDQDGDLDLMVVGDWMPVLLFKNEKGKLQPPVALPKSNGFWNSITAADLDGDGDLDFVLTNHGLNSRFKAGEQHPIEMYLSDFDRNGEADPVITMYNGAKSHPLALRHDLIKQMPSMKKKYLRYRQYKDQTINDMFADEQLKEAIHLSVYQTATCVVWNEGKDNFKLEPLNWEAQLAPMFDALAQDFTGDGKVDILLGGNFSKAKPEVGTYNATYGILLKNIGRQQFEFVPATESGLHIKGDIRSIKPIQLKNGKAVLVARNNDGLITLSEQ